MKLHKSKALNTDHFPGLSMTIKYHGFQDLPVEVAERLKTRIIEGERKQYPVIRKDASIDEIICAQREAERNPDYTEEELVAIIDAFMIFNTAVKRGLPNQLYQMLARSLDTTIAQIAYAARAIWNAHDGCDLAKYYVQELADELKAEIDKRADWSEEQFTREYWGI